MTETFHSVVCVGLHPTSQPGQLNDWWMVNYRTKYQLTPHISYPRGVLLVLLDFDLVVGDDAPRRPETQSPA